MIAEIVGEILCYCPSLDRELGANGLCILPGFFYLFDKCGACSGGKKGQLIA